jgi:hypothetical protein
VLLAAASFFFFEHLAHLCPQQLVVALQLDGLVERL